MSRNDYARAEIVRPALLGQDAAEAQRLAVAGRPIRLLKESREFDASRLETDGLFPPAQRGMFGDSK